MLFKPLMGGQARAPMSVGQCKNASQWSIWDPGPPGTSITLDKLYGAILCLLFGCVFVLKQVLICFSYLGTCCNAPTQREGEKTMTEFSFWINSIIRWRRMWRGRLIEVPAQFTSRVLRSSGSSTASDQTMREILRG